MQVALPALGVSDLAEKEGAAVTEAGDVAAELVAGIGLGHRRGAVGHRAAHQELDAFGLPQPRRVES